MAAPGLAEEHPRPQLIVLNEALAVDLGFDPQWLASDEGIRFLTGHGHPDGTTPVALAYAGHQFGQLSPVLGDGRALLLGEVSTEQGDVFDLHAKGTGLTAYSRPGSDGRGTLSSMLREYLFSEYLHAVGLPTTRSLAVLVTGRPVARNNSILEGADEITKQPAAICVRVAESHLRIGTLQFAAMHQDKDTLVRLVEYCIDRHFPELARGEYDFSSTAEIYQQRRDFFSEVMKRQAATIAAWMRLGFIHGVMNTDNTTISGQTIDFGPCAFVENFDLGTCYSSIDTAGRYAFGNQPNVLHWNLAQLAQALLPVFGKTPEDAIEWAQGAVDNFPQIWDTAFGNEMSAALGIYDIPQDQRVEVVNRWQDLLQQHKPDLTLVHRALVALALKPSESSARDEVLNMVPDERWIDQWLALRPDGAAMNVLHPYVIPRNIKVEEALKAATEGDLEPFNKLCEALFQPMLPAPEEFSVPSDSRLRNFQTFCGT